MPGRTPVYLPTRKEDPMSPDDPHHGTVRGYNKHYRDNESPCDPCRAAKREESSKLRKFKDDDVALTDGAWRFDPFRRVQVWVPSAGIPAAREPEPEPDAPLP